MPGLLVSEELCGYYMDKEKDWSEERKRKWLIRFRHDMMYCPEKRGFKQVKV